MRIMNNSLKILFLSNRGLLPIQDGHTRRSYNILKGLAEKNQVYFVSLFETLEEIDLKNVKKLENLCAHVEFWPAPPKNISISMLSRLTRSMLSLDPYTIWRHYSKNYLKRVNQLISSYEFDLVHCDILPLAYLIRNRNDIYRSITDHDVSYLKCLRMGKGNSNPFVKIFLYLEALKLKRLESNIFRQVDLGIVVSEFDKNILQGLCSSGKLLVIENGVEVNQFIPVDETNEANTLVWIGGFNHLPNCQGIYYFLEKIYPKIKQAFPDVKFSIIGGHVTHKLRIQASNDNSVKLMGYIEDPLPIIQHASVFVAPILSGGGTKLKVLEAMAAGKAIVSTSVGCEGIKGLDGVHYIIADDPDKFARASIELLNDDNLRREIGRNARQLVKENYDYVQITKKLNLYYKEEIKRLKPRRLHD